MRRRIFLQQLGGGALACAWTGPLIVSNARAGLGPNDKIVIALIGCGGMGNHHLQTLTEREDVEIAAVCDVYIPRCRAAQEKVGAHCAGYQDYRRILDRTDIDAIFVATPDHWHALMTVHGCQAGKDVYVEKPLSTTVYEGRKIVEAARRYGRVVQVGIQQRSMAVFRRAVELVQQGRLGDVVTARTWIGANRNPGLETPMDPPPDLDWDMWLGPAPWVPFSPQRAFGFRAFDDYAGGELTNWGPHLVDIAMWGLRAQAPLSIQALGGSFRAPSSSDAETLEVAWEFPGGLVTWSQAFQEDRQGKSYGVLFQGTTGKLTVDRQNFVVEPESLGIEPYQEAPDFWIQVKGHHDDFFDCMRTRALPRADCEIGHRATSACLLGNIAIDLKRTLYWDGHTETFLHDEAANRHLHRPYRAPWTL